MLVSVRNAVIASKALRMAALAADSACPPERADRDLLSWKEALYLATLGGAEALGIQVFNSSGSSITMHMSQ